MVTPTHVHAIFVIDHTPHTSHVVYVTLTWCMCRLIARIHRPGLYPKNLQVMIRDAHWYVIENQMADAIRLIQDSSYTPDRISE
jgi:hypothetical protein